MGWGTKGIWPPCTRGDDINAVDRSPAGDGIFLHYFFFNFFFFLVLVCSDDFSKVKLFKYPAHTLKIKAQKKKDEKDEE